MSTSKTFSAPWGKSLVVISVFSVLLLLAVFATIFFSLGLSFGSPLGILILITPVLIISVALLFIVRSYCIEDGKLHVVRSFWKNSFDLSALKSVETDPSILSRSIRICGNGGMFSFTGIYKNKDLGNYRAFVNDLKNVVVLRFKDEVVALSPGDVEDFVETIQQSLP